MRFFERGGLLDRGNQGVKEANTFIFCRRASRGEGRLGWFGVRVGWDDGREVTFEVPQVLRTDLLYCHV